MSAIISMRVVQEDDGTFKVEVFVAGLLSLDQANAAAKFIEAAICGGEITKQ